MQRKLSSLYVLLAVITVPPALSQTAPTGEASSPAEPPALRLPGDVRPLEYRLELRIDPAAIDFPGRVEIDVELERATEMLWLHAAELEIHQATLSIAGARQVAETVTAEPDFLGLRFADPVGPGRGRIVVDYEGTVTERATTGLFRQQEGGRWYVFSQLESIYTRRVAPSFDEPLYKVPWQLTLSVPSELVAVSNTPVEETAELGDGWKRVRFAPTPPMPSYLLALGIGPFDVVDLGTAGSRETPLRILTLHGKGGDVDYVARIMPELFEALEEYFGIPYPYAKLDSLTIPQTVAFGAMENAGLITYVERLLVAPQGEETVDFRRRSAEVIVHEIAHQWFGNLVTLAWWNDIWLNESFATWMEDEILERRRPEWDRAAVRVEERSEALDGDLLPSARRIRQPIETPGDIFNAFDNVSYGKGASILAMFEGWMGEEAFRTRVREYLQQHRWGTTTSEDFLAALSAGGFDRVGAAFDTFLEQPGAPLLRAEVDCEGEGPPVAVLEQRRLEPFGLELAAQTWQIPVCLSYGRAERTGRSCVLLSAATTRVPLEEIEGCPDWLNANDGSTGYYRTEYAGDLLPRLLDRGGDSLSLAERVGVVGDVEALAETGVIPIGAALDLVPRFADSESRQLIEKSAEITAAIDDHLVPAHLEEPYQRFVRDTFGERAAALGWTAGPTSGEDERLLRKAVVGLVAWHGEDPELVDEASRLARAWLEDHSVVPAEMAEEVLAVAARAGDDALLAAYRTALTEEQDRRDRRRLFFALGAFRDPQLLAGALELLLDERYDIRESLRIVLTAIKYPETRETAWEFFASHLDEMMPRLPPEMSPFLPYLAAGFCDRERQRQVHDFFAPRLDRLPGAARSLSQVEETIRICAARREAQLPQVAAFLERFVSSRAPCS